MTKPKTPPRDFFGNVIEVGDRFFNGNPCITGVVNEIKGKSIQIQRSSGKVTSWMRFGSPDKGICLDKIPNDAANTVYKVTWRMWKGIEPCGVAEYESFQQSFTNLAAALLLFEVKSLYHERAKLTKITTELLEESDD